MPVPRYRALRAARAFARAPGRHVVLRWVLLAWIVGYPLMAILASGEGHLPGGRAIWLAGIAALALAVWRTRPHDRLSGWLRRVHGRRSR